ncbi:MAG: amidase [Lewinellaceae bacterium]|nr:amidase [Lewinellaceae bacterium]
MLRFDEYRQYDALGLAALVQKGEVTPDALLEIAIERAEQVNPQINAIVHKLYDLGKAAAQKVDKQAPFAGVPFLVKDLGLDIKDTPQCIGSRGYKNKISQFDSLVVEKIRKAGLLIFGKTNTPEFGITPYTEPELFGPCRNPWNLNHSPGGSSGGSAAAVAAGITPIATANDGGGSIRIPASCCGLFGIKPTRGRTTWAPNGEMWSGAAVEGCVSRTVRDSAAYLDAILGGSYSDPYLLEKPARPYLAETEASPGKLRIAYSREHTFGHPVSPDCLTALDKAVDLLRQEGHTLEEIPLPYRVEDLTKAFIVVVSAETAADLQHLGEFLGRKVRPSDTEANTFAFHLLGKSWTAAEYAYAKRKWQEIGSRLAAVHEEYDLFLTPTLARPPLAIGALKNPPGEAFLVNIINRLRLGGLAKTSIDQLANKIYDYMPWTAFANISGQPSMSIPMHRNAENLPIGVMLTARICAEDVLFRVAAQMEKSWDKGFAQL